MVTDHHLIYLMVSKFVLVCSLKVESDKIIFLENIKLKNTILLFKNHKFIFNQLIITELYNQAMQDWLVYSREIYKDNY